MSVAILAMLVAWVKAYQAEPLYTALIGVGAGLGMQVVAAKALAGRIEARGRLAGRPVLVLSAMTVLAVCLLWAGIDAILAWQGAPLLGERLLVAILPAELFTALPALSTDLPAGLSTDLAAQLPADLAAALPAGLPADLAAGLTNGATVGQDPMALARALLGLSGDGAGLHLPPAVTIPLGLLAAGALHLGIGSFLGGILAELVALQTRPDDVIMRERVEKERARAQARVAAEAAAQARAASADGRPAGDAEGESAGAPGGSHVPAPANSPAPADTSDAVDPILDEEVASIEAGPLPDDRLGRLYKILGHWNDPVHVERRFLRWYEPQTRSLHALVLAGAVPCGLGYLPVPVWVGAMILAGALRLPARSRPAPRPRVEAAEHAGAADHAPVEAAGPGRPFVEDPAIAPHLVPVTMRANRAPAPGRTSQREQRAGQSDQGRGRLWNDVLGALGVSALYEHQTRAARAFTARRSVLLCTPPDSGRALVTDALVLQAVLADAESVLYLAPDAERARAARARFDARAEATHWKWNIAAADLTHAAGAADPARSQPTLIFADPEAVHRELCARQERWQTFLAGLGALVLPDLHEHGGVRAAHLAHVLQRLYRAMHRARAATGGRRMLAATEARAAARVLVTADPGFADLLRFAQRIVGGALERIGPEHDTAPRPRQTVHVVAREYAAGAAGALLLRDAARAHGLRVALHGYDDVLAAAELDAHGDIADAEVIVARLSPARAAALPVLTRHLGGHAGQPPGAHPVAVLWQPDPDPVSGQMAIQMALPATGAPASATDAAAGEREAQLDGPGAPALVSWPRAPEVERAHLLCTLAEGEVLEEELEQRFSRDVLDATQAALDEQGGLVARTHRLLDPHPGIVRTARGLRLAARDGAHDRMQRLTVCGAPQHLVERATGAVVAVLEAARAPAAAYPRRVMIVGGRRLVVLDAEAQDQRERILCEPTDERVMTVPIRVLDVVAVERRAMERRSAARRHTQAHDGSAASSPRDSERRRGGMHDLGGAPFSLQHRDADIDETVLGVRRFDLRGRAVDSSVYDEPVRCRFRGRVAVLGFPARALAPEVLHALVHGFRTCLPALVCHGDDDLEVVAMPAHGDEAVAVAFVDMHPGGAGFAEAVDIEVIGELVRRALALMRDCPAGCTTGCPACLHTWTCRAPAEQYQRVDKTGAESLLAALLSGPR